MKLHPGLKWHIFHILTSEGIDDVIFHSYTLLFVQKYSCLYNKKEITTWWLEFYFLVV